MDQPSEGSALSSLFSCKVANVRFIVLSCVCVCVCGGSSRSCYATLACTRNVPFQQNTGKIIIKPCASPFHPASPGCRKKTHHHRRKASKWDISILILVDTMPKYQPTLPHPRNVPLMEAEGKEQKSQKVTFGLGDRLPRRDGKEIIIFHFKRSFRDFDHYDGVCTANLQGARLQRAGTSVDLLLANIFIDK